ncbi:hypothetical protein SLUN_04765 [Streptomyces lunaelactis]|uniref:DUF6924 domain-containing protein n=1 Tax=Streptomyces lunaelactis TaxID=1535768 RepID=A0A2R4SXK3_9ACTN|nr:hypothetical protein [Streptomyces lunaelactis]AVZ71603.1 hypothetical protein SLUN_04765 [Streptomyces lunaelactis]NUK84063.1 hypothetical protein [Streptomyces lunaelactis]
MKSLPQAEATLLIRTDFSDQAAWEALQTAVATPQEEDFLAYVDIVDDPAYRDLTSEQVTSLAADGELLIVADTTALTEPGMPLLVILKSESDGGELRVIAKELASIENNISIANMDWSEFVDGADEDGVFRGF